MRTDCSVALFGNGTAKSVMQRKKASVCCRKRRSRLLAPDCSVCQFVIRFENARMKLLAFAYEGGKRAGVPLGRRHRPPRRCGARSLRSSHRDIEHLALFRHLDRLLRQCCVTAVAMLWRQMVHRLARLGNPLERVALMLRCIPTVLSEDLPRWELNFGGFFAKPQEYNGLLDCRCSCATSPQPHLTVRKTHR